MKITSFVVSVSLAFIFLATAPNASGSIVTESLTVTIVESGSFDGLVGTGSFSYDDAFVIDGDETLDSDTSLELDFTILGQNFANTLDGTFPALFSLEFENSVPSFLTFLITEDDIDGLIDEESLTDIIEPGVLAIAVIDFLSPAAGGFGFETTGVIVPVPEPSSIVLWTTVGLAALVRKRR